MRLCLLFLPLLLNACGEKAGVDVSVAPSIPADLLRPVSGYTGPLPHDEKAYADAAHAEQRGRMTCNLQLEAVADLAKNPLPPR